MASTIDKLMQLQAKGSQEKVAFIGAALSAIPRAAGAAMKAITPAVKAVGRGVRDTVGYSKGQSLGQLEDKKREATADAGVIKAASVREKLMKLAYGGQYTGSGNLQDHRQWREHGGNVEYSGTNTSEVTSKSEPAKSLGDTREDGGGPGMIGKGGDDLEVDPDARVVGERGVTKLSSEFLVTLFGDDSVV